jgi:hypothetical protein
MSNITKVVELLSTQEKVDGDAVANAIRKVYETKTISSMDLSVIREELDQRGVDVSFCFEDGEYEVSTLGDYLVINPENKQKTMYMLTDKDSSSYSEAAMELTLTTPYHAWSDTIADQLLSDLEKGYMPMPSEAEREEYNDAVATFNIYGDASPIHPLHSINDMIDIINNNSSQI